MPCIASCESFIRIATLSFFLLCLLLPLLPFPQRLYFLLLPSLLQPQALQCVTRDPRPERLDLWARDHHKEARLVRKLFYTVVSKAHLSVLGQKICKVQEIDLQTCLGVTLHRLYLRGLVPTKELTRTQNVFSGAKLKLDASRADMIQTARRRTTTSIWDMPSPIPDSLCTLLLLGKAPTSASGSIIEMLSFIVLLRRPQMLRPFVRKCGESYLLCPSRKSILKLSKLTTPC